MTREHYDYLMSTFTKVFDKTQTTNRYITSLEQRITELEYEGQLQWDTHQMCQSINLNKIRELESPKRCFDCRDKYDCYSYTTLTEDQTYFMCCTEYEPKAKV